MYEPSLSYAELSEFNIDQMALTDDTKKATVKVKFEAAMETQQRVVEAIRDTDRKLMKDFLNITGDLFTALNNTHTLCSDVSALSTKYKFPNILDAEDESPITDIEEAKKRVKDLDATEDGMKIAFWDTRDQLERVRKMLLGWDNGQWAADTIQYCIDNNLNGNEDANTLCGPGSRPPGTPNIMCDDKVLTYCFVSSLTTLPSANNGVYDGGDENRAREIITADLSRHDEYKENVEWAFAGQTLAPVEFADHYSCDADLDRYQNQVLVDFLSLMDTIKTLGNVSNLTAAKEIFVEIDDAVNTKLAPYLLVNDTMNTWRVPARPGDDSEEKVYDSRQLKCYWYLDLLKKDIDDYEDSLDSTATNIKSYQSSVRLEFKEIVKQLLSLINYYNDDLSESVAAVQSYLDRDITKKNLSETFTDHNLIRSISEISSMKTSLISLLDDFDDAYLELGHALEINYENMFKKTFPLLLDSNKEDFEFLQKMLEWYSDQDGKALMDEYFQLGGKIEAGPFKIEPNSNITESNIWLVVQDSLKGFQHKGMTQEKGLNAFRSDVTLQITSQITELTNQYDILLDEMRTYSRAIQMDTQFYKLVY